MVSGSYNLFVVRRVIKFDIFCATFYAIHTKIQELIVSAIEVSFIVSFNYSISDLWLVGAYEYSSI